MRGEDWEVYVVTYLLFLLLNNSAEIWMRNTSKVGYKIITKILIAMKFLNTVKIKNYMLFIFYYSFKIENTQYVLCLDVYWLWSRLISSCTTLLLRPQWSCSSSSMLDLPQQRALAMLFPLTVMFCLEI